MKLNEIIESFLSQTKTELIENYDRLGLRASGKWANSLQGGYEVNDLTIRVFMTGEKYTGALVKGRKPTETFTPGNPTLYQIILDWIKVKGIKPKEPEMTDKTLAFLISRKIHRDGIKVGPGERNPGTLVSDVVNTQSINSLVGKIINSSVRNIFIIKKDGNAN